MKISTIFAYVILLILVIAVVAGASLAIEGPYSAEPNQRINGGVK